MTAPFPARHARARGQRLRLVVLALMVIILAALITVLVVRVTAGQPGQQAQPGKPGQPGQLPSTLAVAPLMSQAEAGGNVSLGRDCGYSAPLPADSRESLWLFCDTPVYSRQANGNWAFTQFISGSTAAVGAAAAGPGPGITEPGTLTETGTPRAAGPGPQPADGPTAPGVLAPFLATPSGLITSTGLPCGNGSGSYAASWVSGVTRVPSTPDLLITFNNYCVIIRTGAPEPEGFGLAEYDPATRTLSHEATVFGGAAGSLSGAPALGSPVFSGPYLYLYGADCPAPAHGHCGGTLVEARVPANPRAWADPVRYQWRSTGPSGPWSSDPSAATPLIAGPGPVSAVDVAGYAAAGHEFVAIEQLGVAGSFTVFQAPAPTGPWTRITSGQVSCRSAHPGYASFCRAIIGHPELSTRDELVLSYFDPAVGPAGHVMVEGFRW